MFPVTKPWRDSQIGTESLRHIHADVAAVLAETANASLCCQRCLLHFVQFLVNQERQKREQKYP
jgi:hypothetical protein